MSKLPIFLLLLSTIPFKTSFVPLLTALSLIPCHHSRTPLREPHLRVTTCERSSPITSASSLHCSRCSFVHLHHSDIQVINFEIPYTANDHFKLLLNGVLDPRPIQQQNIRPTQLRRGLFRMLLKCDDKFHVYLYNIFRTVPAEAASCRTQSSRVMQA
jgi:hypothetical protein